MGVFDKFLDIMKLNDDDYDDDEFYDDDDEFYEDDYDEKPRRSLFGKKSHTKDEYDDFDVEENNQFAPANSSKVTPMRQPASRRGNANMEVCVVKPTSVDDSREITETLPISGNLQKISNYIFLVTPTNVDISGDLQDLLSGSMEQPTVRGRF